MLGTSRLARLPAALLRWSATLVAFVISAEIFARLDDWTTWGAPILGAYSHAELLTSDSMGVHGRPAFRFKKWRMNNVGFRGADIARRPAQGVTRIAVLGASETFGLYEDEGREFPARMQRELDSLAPGKFEVINCALPGLTLATMTRYYQRVVAPFDPTLVLVYPSTAFYLWDEAPRPSMKVAHAERAGPLRIVERLREALKPVVPSAVVTFIREQRLARVRSRHPVDWAWQSVPASRLELLGEHFRTLVQAVEGSGALPVLVTHTNRFDGAAGDARGEARRHLVNVLAEYFPRASEGILLSIDSSANSIMRTIASERGVPVIEASGRLEPSPRHFADYVHFTNDGASALARVVAREVLALGSGSFETAPERN